MRNAKKGRYSGANNPMFDRKETLAKFKDRNALQMTPVHL
jgi:hypothetical protein